MTQKQYKTFTLWLLILTAAALVLTAAMLSLKRTASAARSTPAYAPEEPGMAYYTPNPALSQENPKAGENTGSAEEGGPYVVGLYQGKLGVFPQGGAEPVLTADVPVYLLPEEDLTLLKKGIPAQTLSEARKILEDYH
jgi:hypothetical protein